MRRLRVRPSQRASGGLGRHRPAQLHGSVRQRAGGADESGGNPVESRAFEWAPLSVSRRRSRGRRKNAAVERREANALRHWACAARRSNVTPRLSALCSLTFAEGDIPLSARGWKCPAPPAPCENRGGGALVFVRRLFEMCIGRSRTKARRAFWQNEPEVRVTPAATAPMGSARGRSA